MVFAPIPNRAYHESFMRKAIDMAESAFRADETPVGCVFVHDGKVIGRGINGTNASLNGTRHAEFVGLAEIMAAHPPAILRETDLYVTVEPCVMCASALRQYGVRAVYFGCLNDRFGGCGGVMNVHADVHPNKLEVMRGEDEEWKANERWGEKCGFDREYPVFGGLFREEAIMLLRRFYVQENNKAPEPKPKKNRELKTEILPVTVTPVALQSVAPLTSSSNGEQSIQVQAQDKTQEKVIVKLPTVPQPPEVNAGPSTPQSAKLPSAPSAKPGPQANRPVVKPVIPKLPALPILPKAQIKAAAQPATATAGPTAKAATTMVSTPVLGISEVAVEDPMKKANNK